MRCYIHEVRFAYHLSSISLDASPFVRFFSQTDD